MNIKSSDSNNPSFYKYTDINIDNKNKKMLLFDKKLYNEAKIRYSIILEIEKFFCFYILYKNPLLNYKAVLFPKDICKNFVLKDRNDINKKIFTNEKCISSINKKNDFSYLMTNQISISEKELENLENIVNNYKYGILSTYHDNKQCFCFIKINNFEKIHKTDKLYDIRFYLENIIIYTYDEIFDYCSKKDKKLEQGIWDFFILYFQKKVIEIGNDERVFNL